MQRCPNILHLRGLVYPGSDPVQVRCPLNNEARCITYKWRIRLSVSLRDSKYYRCPHTWESIIATFCWLYQTGTKLYGEFVQATINYTQPHCNRTRARSSMVWGKTWSYLCHVSLVDLSLHQGCDLTFAGSQQLLETRIRCFHAAFMSFWVGNYVIIEKRTNK